ncbi:hypothetical protein FB45DRAFT_75470 [Roridomyces roridus]|uniref:Uncharacterized protein n=1 Tax=Roridomyces roridus TaxID=1738132 RepID=A0AAD7BP65_9AGAR|nr:hypothetical protein FB45DRAFT_75470 [Roridomyces roridus]
MLAIHNTHFVQSLRENPDDPYYTPHASSFFSATRNACEIITAHIQNFGKHEELFLRWWAVWTSLFNAALILGAVAAKCSQNMIGPKAFVEFFVAVDLFERGAETSFRACGALPFLHRLRDKAIAAYAQYPGQILGLE